MDLLEIPLGNQSIKRRCLRIVSIRDNEFIIDQTTFDEIVDADDYLDEKIPVSESQIGFHRMASMRRVDTNLIDDKYDDFGRKISRANMTSQYSVNWPYCVLSGLDNYIMIFNAYDH